MAIKSFKKDSLRLFFEEGVLPKKCSWKAVAKIAKRKLDMIHFALDVQDLKAPPSNHLKKLSGNYRGYYSIRINNQWRVVFKWNLGAIEVDIIDYH